MAKSIKITALTPQELAKLLSGASRKAVSAEDIRAIAETAGILSAKGTVNLIEYTAFLVREIAGGS